MVTQFLCPYLLYDYKQLTEWKEIVVDITAPESLSYYSSSVAP
jgi:hypothetical protein